MGAAPHRKDNDYSSGSASIEQLLVGANPLVKPPVTSSAPKKSVTIDALVTALPQPAPTDSASNSWSQQLNAPKSVHDQTIRQAKKVEDWASSSTSHSDTDDSSSIGEKKVRTPPLGFQQTQPFSALNGTSMFTTTASPTKQQLDDSRSEEDSIEAAVQKFYKKSPSEGIQGLVNRQMAPNPASHPSVSVLHSVVQSPVADDSAWSTSSVGGNQAAPNKAINALINQQPLLSKKPSESTWDDSRPLSADLKGDSFRSKRSSSASSSSTRGDDDDDRMKQTVINTKAPSQTTNSSIANLVNKSIRPAEPAESKGTGVDNLTKIMDTIMRSAPVKQTK